MTRVKQLRKIFGYTQDKLAKLLNVSRSAVAMWEASSQEPDYDTLRKLSQIFDIPPDFVVCKGIFSKWDQIIKYYDAVSAKLKFSFPMTLVMPSFCADKNLAAWLDTRLYFEPDELQLARWFAFSVRDIEIIPTGTDSGGGLTADVSVEFTPEFQALIDAEIRNVARRQQNIGGDENAHCVSEMDGKNYMVPVRDLTAKKDPAPAIEDGPSYPPEYDLLSPEDRELIDSMIRRLILEKNQEGGSSPSNGAGNETA